MTADKRQSVAVISGPSGSGKTRLAIDLAEILGAEIINADSVQAYTGFDIGSSKASAEEIRKVPHHLLSFLNPEEEFNAGQFLDLAAGVITEVTNCHKLPLIVGGTGLYIRSLLCGLVPLPSLSQHSGEEIDTYEADLREKGLKEDEIRERMYLWLVAIDPTTAKSLRKSDRQRVRRALLVSLSSGISLRALQEGHKHSDLRYRALVLILLPQRERLYQAIERRVDDMFAKGFVDEVRNLKKSASSQSKAFYSIGYRHVLNFLEGNQDYQQTVTQMKRDTRRLAKRQITWWRNQPQVLGWHDLTEQAATVSMITSYHELCENLTSMLRDFYNRSGIFSGRAMGVDFLSINMDYCISG